MNSITIKSDLLCYGISADFHVMKLFEQQNPNAIWRTGSNGIFIEFDNTQVLVSIKHRYNSVSPYKYSINKKYLIKNNNIIKENVSLLSFPDWWNHVKLSSGRAFNDVFLFEGKGFFHQAYKGCDYVKKNAGCTFCSTGVRNSKDISPVDIGEAANMIKYYMSNAQICLGGGTYLPVSRNVYYFIECARKIRTFNQDIPIWVEMIPPSKTDILRLIEAGITGFNFNIEVWDCERRKYYCPGKFEIGKNHYLDILAFSANLLPNCVGSSFIVGLDFRKNILKAVDEMINIGVIPCLLPFRPFNGSPLETEPPCDSIDFLELNYYTIEKIYENDLRLDKSQGCVLCGCCTIMQDIWREKYQTNYVEPYMLKKH